MGLFREWLSRLGLVLALVFGLAQASGFAMAQTPASSTLRLERNLQPEQTISQDGKEVKRPVFLRGDSAQGRGSQETTMVGNAEARVNGTTIKANRITYYQDDDELIAEGSVQISREGNVFSGPRLQLKVASKLGVFENPSYKLGLYRGSGSARSINFLGEKHYSLIDASYTTCDPVAADWHIYAKRIEIDETGETGTAEGARLVFGNRTIVSLPYLPFPIGDARKSGFLTPSLFFNSRTGAELVLPYYFNLAPNRDLTVEAHISLRRGLTLSNRFNYLEKPMFGSLRFDLNPHDIVTGKARYYVQSRNSIVNAFGWSGSLNASAVSDDSYLSTYSRSQLEAAQTKLPRELNLTRGIGDGWNANITVRSYQNILAARDSLTETPYNVLPKFDIKKTYELSSGWQVTQAAELARFDRHVTGTASGGRAMSNTTVSYPIQQLGAFFVPKLSVNAAAYELNDNPGYARSFTRVLPTLSLDSGLIFERPVQWRGRSLTQTLEPRIFYARTPYKDQTGIPVFDTTAASFGFSQLFSESPFLGQDRIADVNQVSLGLTSRWLEDDGKESLRASIGQRFYIEDQRVALPTGVPITGRKSDVLMSLGSEIVRNVHLDAYSQYTTDTKKLSRFSVNLQYSPDPQRLANLGLRYLKDPRDLVNQIFQTDASWRWPMTKQWATMGRVNYSFLNGSVNAAGQVEKPRLVEGLLGVEYDWDCWVARVVVNRFIASDSKPNTQVMFQLELKGLGRLGNNPFDILRRSIPGFRVPNERPGLPSSYFGYD